MRKLAFLLCALLIASVAVAADQIIRYNEKMIGAGHPTLADTLNRGFLIDHSADGTHKDNVLVPLKLKITGASPATDNTAPMYDNATGLFRWGTVVTTPTTTLPWDNITGTNNIAGDNTGRIQGYSFGSASFTDNGYFRSVTGNGTGNISSYDNATFTGTVSSPKIGSASYTDNGYFKYITGDNTGRVQGFSFGSASYTDNGYFGDVIAKSPWVDARAYGFSPDNTGALNRAALTAAVAYAAPLRKPVFIRPGSYTVDVNTTGVAILDNTTIFGAGRDLVSITVSGVTTGVQKVFGSNEYAKVSNIHISGITFIGTKPPAYPSGSFSNHALFFNYVSDVVVENCRFKYFGTQVFFNGHADVATNDDAENIYVRNNEFLGDAIYTPAVGVQLYSGRNVDISGNLFAYGSRPVSLEQGGAAYKLRNVRVIGNTFMYGKTADLSATNIWGGIDIAADTTGTIYGVTISGNTFFKTNTDNNSSGADIQTSKAGDQGIAIIGNTHYNTTGWATIINNAQGVTISGNTYITDNASLVSKGINVIGLAKSISVTGNTFHGPFNQEITIGALTSGAGPIEVSSNVSSTNSNQAQEWTATDNVSVFGTLGTPSTQYKKQIYINGSDNVFYIVTNAPGMRLKAADSSGTIRQVFLLTPQASTVDAEIHSGNLRVAEGNLKIDALPTSSPGAGTKKFWYDTTDNTVKYAP